MHRTSSAPSTCLRSTCLSRLCNHPGTDAACSHLSRIRPSLLSNGSRSHNVPLLRHSSLCASNTAPVCIFDWQLGRSAHPARTGAFWSCCAALGTSDSPHLGVQAQQCWIMCNILAGPLLDGMLLTKCRQPQCICNPGCLGQFQITRVHTCSCHVTFGTPYLLQGLEPPGHTLRCSST